MGSGSGLQQGRSAPATLLGPAICILVALLLAVLPRAAQAQAAKASASFQQAQALFQQGRLAEARTETLDQLQRNPASVEGLNLLGFIEIGAQNYPDAIAAFQKALRVAPNSTKTRVNLGNAYVAAKQIALAESEFKAALRIDPANRDANYNLGVLLLSKGSAGSAAEAILHLERVHPANVPTRFNLIQAYFQTKQTAAALRMATALSSDNPKDVQVHFTLGVLLAGENQWKPAQLELSQADLLAPGTFEILYNLGQAYLRGGDLARAELTAERALKTKPESPDALYLLAQAYSKDARLLDALDLLVRAHKLAPDNTDVIFLMAQIGMSQNYYEDAIPLLESGVKIAPGRADLLAALGQSYFMAGKVEPAVDEFKKLIQLEPSPRSYAFLGISYRNLGRFDEAAEYFRQGLKLDPQDPTCLYNLGYIAERQGDSAAAEAKFQAVYRSHPDFPEVLLELANLRIAQKRLPEAETLLKQYVQVSRDPGTGYYKLAMVERALHETAAADRDLGVFQTLSKNAAPAPHYFEHLFDYLDTRSRLAPDARNQLDLADLTDQIKKHPDQPEALYLLAEAYLKSGKVDEARSAIAQLDQLTSADFRTLTGVGVLLARYRLYDEAIQHFQAALQADPGSDGVQFDLANAYFRKGLYPQALEAAEKVSEEGRKDDAYLALLGDIYAHLGDVTRAEEIDRAAIARNPDNDQAYLSLALLEFRQNDVAGARHTLLQGQARIPASGKILWGLGIASALQGQTADAAAEFERAVDTLPEWPGSYSTLGVFYYETGQLDKAREVLSRFKSSTAVGGLDVNRIAQTLERAPAPTVAANEPLSLANRHQLLQLALTLADRTL